MSRSPEGSCRRSSIQDSPARKFGRPDFWTRLFWKRRKLAAFHANQTMAAMASKDSQLVSPETRVARGALARFIARQATLGRR